MHPTIRDEEETVTQEVLRFCSDATEWEASTSEWDNGYFLYPEVAATTPAGIVTVDLHNTVAADALTSLSGLLGGVGQRTIHTVTIDENWTPAPPAPHVITLHDAPGPGECPGPELEMHVESVDDTGVTGGDLANSFGNLHIRIDGADVGSLWFHRPTPDAPITVTLGTHDDEEGWVEVGTLPRPAGPTSSGARSIDAETPTQK